MLTVPVPVQSDLKILVFVLQMEKSKQSTWMGSGRIALLRHNGSIVKSTDRERERFSFSGAFKTYTTPWEGRPSRFPPNNELSGEGHGKFPAR
jgi:hypothetical protein